ncbi:hypothetical protein ACP70R_048061 [Stipagrostis hirtigluma subsp. patula]
MLKTANPVQLRVLVAIKAKDKSFVSPSDIMSPTDLADVLLGRRCENCYFLPLPANDCECNICATKKRFCNICMCMICNKLGYNESGTGCFLLRCAICRHGVHMDCVINDDRLTIEGESYIKNGTVYTKRLFMCKACQGTSELLKCVRDYLGYIMRDTFVIPSAEIQYVCTIFRRSTDSDERKLLKECAGLLAISKWSNNPDEVDNIEGLEQLFREMDNNEYMSKGLPKALEHLLNNASAEPIELSYAILAKITNGFSQVIGRGGFGVVYKGVFQNKEVAVKKLKQTAQFSDKQFEDELGCLRRVKHENIVRFLGYCSDTQKVTMQHEGQYVLADDRRRFLCFEYAANKSLRDYLKDESRRHEWHTQYKLIEGICHGLHYLHKEERITHLDLKPENILIDADMVPKITDFGISRRFSGAQSKIITTTLRGTPGYTAPEYWNRGEISFKADIFSLGIIIKEIFCGSIQSTEFDNWYQSQVIHSPQLKRCIEISKRCVDDDLRKRPTMDFIIGILSKKDA